MKRFHVHVHVEDLAKSIAFYSQLFGAQPIKAESDYAKWCSAAKAPQGQAVASTTGSSCC